MPSLKNFLLSDQLDKKNTHELATSLLTAVKPFSPIRKFREDHPPVLSINSSSLKNVRFLDAAKLDEFFDHKGSKG